MNDFSSPSSLITVHTGGNLNCCVYVCLCVCVKKGSVKGREVLWNALAGVTANVKVEITVYELIKMRWRDGSGGLR